MKLPVLLFVLAAAGSGSEWTLAGRKPWTSGTARGADFVGGQTLVWGRGLPVAGDFAAGGCAGDVNGDGRPDLIVQEAGVMMWLEAPSWRRHRIDGDADFADCLWTRLGSQPGVLLIHRQIQVRFYWQAAGGWQSRDVYSIYTPSAQGGLARGDADGDGREDIFCGNYWMRAPEDPDGRGWRLFAINSWWEQARSAMLRVTLAGPGRIAVSQREAAPARVSLFERPADPKLFWRETPLEMDPPLRFVQALAAGPETVFAAENAGPGSRLIEFRQGRGAALGITSGLFWLRLAGPELTGVGPDAIYRWRRVTTGSDPAGTKKPVPGSKASAPRRRAWCRSSSTGRTC